LPSKPSTTIARRCAASCTDRTLAFTPSASANRGQRLRTLPRCSALCLQLSPSGCLLPARLAHCRAHQGRSANPGDSGRSACAAGPSQIAPIRTLVRLGMKRRHGVVSGHSGACPDDEVALLVAPAVNNPPHRRQEIATSLPAAFILPASRPFAARRSRWLQTGRGPSAPPTARLPLAWRRLKKDLRRPACGLRRVRRPRVRSRL